MGNHASFAVKNTRPQVSGYSLRGFVDIRCTDLDPVLRDWQVLAEISACCPELLINGGFCERPH
jgi:hypothetical protein